MGGALFLLFHRTLFQAGRRHVWALPYLKSADRPCPVVGTGERCWSRFAQDATFDVAFVTWIPAQIWHKPRMSRGSPA